MALTRIAIAAAVLMVVAQASAATPAKRLTAKSAGVRATVTWRNGTGPFVKNVRVRIVRDGVKRLDQQLRKVYDLPVKLRVRDLDGNSEPEVLADFYTGGAHCCWYSLIYGYAHGHYTSLKQQWGDQQYGLADLDHDGTLELRSADDRFAYEFTAYAGSAFPVQIWSYRSGKLVDTTRKYRSAVKRDLAGLWRAYRADRHSRYPDARGILAAWMADEYLLGRQATGWAKMRAVNARGELQGLGSGDIWPKGAAYLKALRKFLIKLGYAP
jgi:hypothetical protein